MVAVPSGIIIVNDDLTDSVKKHLETQLHISETITGDEFNKRLNSNPDYTDTVKQLNTRVMVIDSFNGLENKDEVDVAIFVKNGLASIQKNNFGPPRQTHEVLNLTWGKLCIFK